MTKRCGLVLHCWDHLTEDNYLWQSDKKHYKLFHLYEFLTDLFCLFRVDDDLKRNLANQKAENVKLGNQIGTLKAEKTQLQ